MKRRDARKRAVVYLFGSVACNTIGNLLLPSAYTMADSIVVSTLAILGVAFIIMFFKHALRGFL